MKLLTLVFIAIGFIVAVCDARPEAALKSHNPDVIGSALTRMTKQQRKMALDIKAMVSRLSPENKLEFRRALERQAQSPVPATAGLSKGLLPSVAQLQYFFFLLFSPESPIPLPLRILLATTLLPLLFPGIPFLTLVSTAIGFIVAVCDARPEAALKSHNPDVIGNALARMTKQQRKMALDIKAMVSRLSPEDKLEFRRALECLAQSPEAALKSHNPDVIGSALTRMTKQQRKMALDIKAMVSRLSPENKLEFRRALERQAQSPVPATAGLSKGLLPSVAQLQYFFFLLFSPESPIPLPLRILLATTLLPLLFPGIPFVYLFEFLGI
ncbi:unnamed protein product [Cyprideis torosa]|uniref:Uncharacterized protein n=1 Tax=Cyprideis torosa TaxID=163714 RepID=A0A7R8ZRC3_9CRUS|nr:unnamed protein product [Cyprideis torosa]CAG0892693.1 unnamed protein product [Cyprideis torosa]